MIARVGPVLRAGRLTDAVIAAVRALNDDVETIDRGAYIRVLVPARCRVTRAAIEEVLGGPFRLPTDLEAIMPSFQGCFHVDEDEAWWDGCAIGATP